MGLAGYIVSPLISTNPTSILSYDAVYPRFHFYRNYWLQFGGALVPDPPVANFKSVGTTNRPAPVLPSHKTVGLAPRRLSSVKRTMTNPKAAFRSERPFFSGVHLRTQLALEASAANLILRCSRYKGTPMILHGPLHPTTSPSSHRPPGHK